MKISGLRCYFFNFDQKIIQPPPPQQKKKNQDIDRFDNSKID